MPNVKITAKMLEKFGQSWLVYGMAVPSAGNEILNSNGRFILSEDMSLPEPGNLNGLHPPQPTAPPVC